MKFLSKSCFQLTLYKAYAELQAESERTYAGFVWWILDPIFTLTVYYLVFQGIVSRGSENFVIFLCVGIVTWRWMQNTVMQSSTSILAGGGLMQQVYLPKIVFPTAIILSDFFKFLIVFVLLIIFLFVMGCVPGFSYISLPLLMIVEGMFITGFAFLAAAIVPFMPDFRLFLTHGLTLGFFLSGIIFPIDKLPQTLKNILQFNPMTILINNYRRVLIHNLWPEWTWIIGTCLFSLLLVICGSVLIKLHDRTYPKIC